MLDGGIRPGVRIQKNQVQGRKENWEEVTRKHMCRVVRELDTPIAGESVS